MPDPILTLVQSLQARGVTLEAVDGRLRYRARCGVITETEKKLLADYVPVVLSILNPDLTLPDELVIPAHCRTLEEIKNCIDSQRIKETVLAGLGSGFNPRLPNVSLASGAHRKQGGPILK
jgi:hypothetical protein